MTKNFMQIPALHQTSVFETLVSRNRMLDSSFGRLCSVLEVLERISLSKLASEQFHSVQTSLAVFFFGRGNSADNVKNITDFKTNLSAVLNLLLADQAMSMPHTQRVYGLKEGIVRHLVPALGLESLACGKRLLAWREHNIKGRRNVPELVAEILAARLGNNVASTLTVHAVDAALDELHRLYQSHEKSAGCSFAKFSSSRLAVLRRIFDAATPIEAKWLLRIIFRNLELPFPASVLCSGLGQQVSRVVRFCGDVSTLCQRAIDILFSTKPLGEIISQCKSPTIGLYLPVALCHKVDSLDKVPVHLNVESSSASGRSSKIIVETKFDGERIQVHFQAQGNRVKLYSRSGYDSTRDRSLAIPDLCRALLTTETEPGCLPRHHRVASLLQQLRQTYSIDIKISEHGVVENCILDGEILIFDEETRGILPFGSVRQHLSTAGDAQSIGISNFSMNFFVDPDSSVSTSLLGKRQSTFASHVHDHAISAKNRKRLIDDGSELIWKSRVGTKAEHSIVDRSSALRSYIEQQQYTQRRHTIVKLFDIVMLNSVSLLKVPLHLRKQILESVVQPIPHRVEVVDFNVIDFADAKVASDQLQDLFIQSCVNHDEGLVVKSFDGHYMPDLRFEWMKLKTDHIKLKHDAVPGMGKSIPLTVVGCSYLTSRAKSHKWRRGGDGDAVSFLLAARLSQSKFRVVCQVEFGLGADEFDMLLAEVEGSSISRASCTTQPTWLVIPPGIISSAPDRWVLQPDSAPVVVVRGSGFLPGAYGPELRFPRLVHRIANTTVTLKCGMTYSEFCEFAHQEMHGDVDRRQLRQQFLVQSSKAEIITPSTLAAAPVEKIGNFESPRALCQMFSPGITTPLSPITSLPNQNQKSACDELTSTSMVCSFQMPQHSSSISIPADLIESSYPNQVGKHSNKNQRRVAKVLRRLGSAGGQQKLQSWDSMHLEMVSNHLITKLVKC